MLGALRLAANRAIEAEADFRAVTEAAPDLAEGWAGLLDALARQRRHAEGRLAAAEAVARHPQDAVLAGRHGAFLLACGEASGAEREARRCVALAPQDEAAWLVLADALWRQQRMRDAVLALEEGLAALPGSGALAARLGHLLIAQDKRVPAIAAFRRAVDAGLAPAHVWLGLTDALWRLQRLAEATEVARGGVAAHPGHAELRARLAQLLLAAGAEEEAGSVLAEAIASRPDSEEVRLAMADALWRQGRRGEAVAAAREAVAAAPDRPAVAARLGHLLLEGGEVEEAAAIFERVTAAAPGLVTGWVGLCDAERQRKRLKAAIEACRRAEQAGADRHTMRMLRYRLYGEIED
jgi:predicted Zn-dependent protease